MTTDQESFYQLNERKFTLSFVRKTRVFEPYQNEKDKFELFELYFLDGGKTKFDVLKRKTGKIYQYITAPTNEEEIIKIEGHPDDIVVYDPETFLPRIIRLVEDQRKNLLDEIEKGNEK